MDEIERKKKIFFFKEMVKRKKKKKKKKKVTSEIEMKCGMEKIWGNLNLMLGVVKKRGEMTLKFTGNEMQMKREGDDRLRK